MKTSIAKRRNFIPLQIIVEENGPPFRSILNEKHKLIISNYEKSRKFWLNIVIISIILITIIMLYIILYIILKLINYYI